MKKLIVALALVGMAGAATAQGQIRAVIKCKHPDHGSATQWATVSAVKYYRNLQDCWDDAYAHRDSYNPKHINVQCST